MEQLASRQRHLANLGKGPGSLMAYSKRDGLSAGIAKRITSGNSRRSRKHQTISEKICERLGPRIKEINGRYVLDGKPISAADLIKMAIAPRAKENKDLALRHNV